MITALVTYRDPDGVAALFVLLVAMCWLLAQFGGVMLLANLVGRYERRLYRPVLGVGCALVLAFAISAVTHAAGDDILILDMCKVWTSSDWEWWFYGCWGLPSTNQ